VREEHGLGAPAEHFYIVATHYIVGGTGLGHWGRFYFPQSAAALFLLATGNAMTLEVISELPAGEAAGPPLLFIHGAWHGAWCWRHLLSYFAGHGYAAHALSLRGHAASPSARPLRMVSISDYVDDVAEVAARLPATPVLVAHSMGAFVAHHYLQKHPAAGVVLLAAVPPRGAWGATWHAMRRHPVVFARVNLTMSLYPLVSTVARAKDMLFADVVPDATVAGYQAQLQDESYRAYLGMLLRPVMKRRSRVPTLVLGTDNDALINASDLRSTARFYGCEPAVIPGAGHDMMLEPKWMDVGETILRWLRR
jgi:pimeloyl-ACP methyl ester carboxylesterase